MINNFMVVIFSLLIGSFLNVIIYRLPLDRSIICPGSYCTACLQKIQYRDLIPILSYILLKGKCRSCSEKISLRYPLVEFLTGISFMLLYLSYGLTIGTIAGLLFTSLLIVSSFIDIDWGIIPDKITGPGVIFGLVLAHFTVSLSSAAAGALFYAGILFAAALISGGGMGGGDIKLAAVIGVFCGMPNTFIAFIISTIAGGLWASFLLLSNRAGRKSVMKFGPFLAVGGYLAYIYGSQIIDFYWLMFSIK